MNPTGELFRTDSGGDLVLTRSFRASAEDVWASLTEPDRTARWYGRWEGDAAPGSTIKVQMAFEEQAPWQDMRIDACEPPRRLALSTTDDSGVWHIEVRLSEDDGSTLLRFVQHFDTEEKLDIIGEIGAGWEYYLDMLVAARDGSPLPDFDAYYPAMKPYYTALRQERS